MHLLSAQHCARHYQEANKRQDSLPQIAGMESVKHSCTKERQTLSPHLCALPLGVMSPPPHPQAHLGSCLLPSLLLSFPSHLTLGHVRLFLSDLRTHLSSSCFREWARSHVATPDRLTQFSNHSVHQIHPMVWAQVEDVHF